MQRVTVGPISKLRTYNTGVWTSSDDTALPYLGRGFTYGRRFYQYRGPTPFEDQQRLHSYLGHSLVSEIAERLEGGDYHWQSAVEILIFASSHDRAQRAANLLFAAMLLQEAQSLVHEHVIALPEDSEELESLSASTVTEKSIFPISMASARPRLSRQSSRIAENGGMPRQNTG